MATVQIVKPGLQTTVQDLGRWGHQASGVPVAGAMDMRAHRTANALVRNTPFAATLEITLVGPELECDRDAVVAVCGARFDVSVDGERAHGQVFHLNAGQRLKFRERHAGARAYLAIDGGFDVPEVLGSRATHVAGGMGGFNGRALRPGDRVAIGEPREHTADQKETARIGIEAVRLSPCVLRVLPAPDLEVFEDDAFDRLLSSTYAVRSESNRMGYRLRGPKLGIRDTTPKISGATPLGLIQVPPSGEPVLLMADRPTTGGYPAIANVITADVDLAAQLAPGDAFRFASCSVDEALNALFERERELEMIEGTRRE